MPVNAIISGDSGDQIKWGPQGGPHPIRLIYTEDIGIERQTGWREQDEKTRGGHGRLGAKDTGLEQRSLPTAGLRLPASKARR